MRIAFIFLPFLLISCLENPLGGDRITGGRREISGTVVLSDGSSPEGVVVWLETFDLITRTDAAGEFHLILPPRPAGESTGTVSQQRVFFYLANYMLATKQVAVVDGAFFYDRGDVDKKGRLRAPVRLLRALRIHTAVYPRPDTPRLFDVDVTLQADEADCASAINPYIGVKDKLAPIDTLGAVLLRHLETGTLTAVYSLPQARGNELLVVCHDPVQRALSFDAAALGLPTGSYLAIPFLLIEPDEVPPGLLAALGLPVTGPDAAYLQKPMRREGGKFEIR